ncbi:MAG: T9SS type A sorting domain-containing protein [Bacteroidetes bacterium]|nr:T9SS type A sorting domain-containing protein [Bacteroidota bacterium]
MKKWVLLAMIWFQAHTVFAQGYNHNWLLGYYPVINGKAEIDSVNFNVFAQVRKMKFSSSQANISDSLGNILFYTNGCWIANVTGDTMMNGSGLNPGNFSNGYCSYGYPIACMQMALPFPDSSHKYILFHQTGDVSVYSRKLYYSVIDMALDSGRGAVTQKNQIAFSDSLILGISACRHANGRDWWVAVLKDSSDIIYTLLLTPHGITNVQQQHLNVPMHVNFSSIQAFSPDGNKYAYTVSSATGNMNYPYLRDLRILDFDRCSGVFSNPYVINLNDTNFGVGLAFSSNSRYLYTSKAYQISQFDLQSSNILASRQFVAWYDFFNYGGYTTFGYMYLAANGKIYITSGNSVQHIHEMNYPDNIGASCDFQQHSIYLNGCWYRSSVPNHPNYYLGCDTTSGCPCLVPTTGINEINVHDFKFSLSPNPTNGSIKIVYLLPQNQKGVFEVYDVTGKKVFSYHLPQWSTLQNFDLSFLGNGVYNCTVTSNNQKVNRKLVVIR